jgi:protein O-mannosyl-transferase
LTSPSGRQPNPPRRADLTIYLLLLAAIAVVFGQLRHYELVDFDDLAYVTANPKITAGLTVDSVVWAFTRAHEGYWSPLTWLSYMADIQFFGVHSGALHMTNVLIHAATTCLVFAVFMRMTRARWPSACVAALFAIHPLHVESVAWVAERKDVLSAFFWFLTIWTYLRYVERPSPMRYVLVAAAFACGLMSKPMIVTLPVVLLLLDFWPLGRFADARSAALKGPPYASPGLSGLQSVGRSAGLSAFAKATADRRSLGGGWSGARSDLALVLEKLPLLSMALVMSAITFVVQRNAGAVVSLGSASPVTRAANAVVSYAVYLLEMIWPRGLAAIYPYPLAVPLWHAALSTVVLATISILVFRAARRFPYLAVGWGWYVVSLLPVIGIVQAGPQARADRYTYVSMVGIAVMVACGLTDAVRGRSLALRRMLGAATFMALAIYAALAWRQVTYWKDTETLFRRAIAVTSGNYVAHEGLGSALRHQGRVDEAIVEFRHAIALYPRYAEARNNLAEALIVQKHPDEALTHVTEALRVNANDAGFHLNRGIALNMLGRPDEAEAEYRAAISLSPGLASARSGLGAILTGKGRYDEAMSELTEAVRLDPNDATAHYNIGTILASRGRMDDAIAEFTIVVRLTPNDVKARNNLGSALAAAGRMDEAIAQFSEAVRLRPDLADVRNNLDLALALRQRARTTGRQ